MKKFLLSVVIMILIVAPILAHALPKDCTDPDSAASTKLCNPIEYYDGNFGSFAMRGVAIVGTFFQLFAVVFVVYSGFRMIISQGDSEKLTEAKNALTWTIYGLIVAMFAFVLISGIGNYLGINNRYPDPGTYTGAIPIIENPLAAKDFGELLGRMLVQFLMIIGILAILMIVIGGFRYVTSGGNSEQSENAKQTVQWAIIGLIVALFGYVIIQATFKLFGV